MALWIWATIGVLALVHILQTCISKGKTKKKMLPPGPRGFPIFGSLHLLGKFPNRDLHQLSRKYGDIMYLRLGLVPTIVVSSPRAAELFLKTHDLVFASRPPHEGSKHISFGQRNLSFAEYGSYWRDIRKMCTLELLSNHKINSFKSMRREEVALLIQSVQEDANNGRVAIDLSDKVSSLSVDMTCKMVFGKKYKYEEFDERGFTAVMKEALKLSAGPNLGDYIPCIAPLDLQGFTKKMKAINKVFDEFFEKIIDEHLQSKDEERTKDFVDVMVAFMGSEDSDYRIERTNIKAIMLDMFAGSMDTTSTTVEWALSELMRHPQVMKKVQKELENVVGLNRMVEESELEKLDYLDMVVKETLRLHPVAPLLVPHAAIEDCIVDGYHVPKKSRVIINAWAIGRDPSAWEDAEKFVPERFEGNSVDVRGNHFQLIPFGSGRRRCPGIQLGLTVVQFVLAQLVHCFDWELPDNMLPNDLDMTEGFGITVSRAKHLLAIPSYRLQN
ncbi:cytochrome P450 CYP736A12-like [Pyrus ussuriensis x Pyrus communis]|uniref:Cytochrome P450 CYP736A12-like n=1 Tax=Pyrus ussuriensis x Pyrus communis TaxID=2448454 RepID=A0A5N5G5S7_9ROSA|nr:cytochrome P450 CYP736A12-like [Pyrus ussuriensis x Pyrus communis]